MNDTVKLYKEAIDVCETWRKQKSLIKATPNEIHLYNVFTRAKTELSQQLACIEDTLGIYMDKEKMNTLKEKV